MNATGVVYTARSVWRGLTICPHAHLLGRIVYFTGVGIQTLLVLYRWLPTAKTGDEQKRIPRFLYVVHVNDNPLALGYQSDHLLLADAKPHTQTYS